MEEARLRGVVLFDSRRFFEAHELFEQVWKSDEIDEGDRLFWKGVTQVAVGCCHVQRGNARGAVAVLARGVDHLRAYPSPHLGIDTEELIEIARSVAERVKQHGASAVLEFPRFPPLRG